ncbi:phage tail tape measure protein [Serratia aquatilis]|uniref:Phage tail tape measure protein n=1 Tax=Serratia aquatilis TaxID=1737515 RepID=A0ABV6E9K1_9GAMM
MTDIASISLRVDTNELQRGSNELDKFQQRATGAAGAADGFNASGKETAKVSKEIAQEVAETHKRVEEYNRRLRETQTTVSASNRVQDQLTESYFRQIDRVKKLGTGTQELNAIQAQIRTARAAGNITQNDYLTLVSHASEKMRELTKAEEVSAAAKSIFIQKLKDQVATQRLSREELLRYRAAQLGVSSSADVYIRKIAAAKNETHAFSLQSAAARRELGVMLGELARGNLGALRSSGITLANRSGLLEQMMTLRGLGIAGVVGGITASIVGLAVAYEKGAAEGREFTRSIIMTGNYAGLTADRMAIMAGRTAEATNGIVSKSAQVLAALNSSGEYTAAQLTLISTAAINMERATGQSIDKTVQQFKSLQGDPLKAVVALNNQYHFLTSSVYDQIAAQVEAGNTLKAQEIAEKALAEVTNARAKEIKDNLGLLESAWYGLGHAASWAWDKMLGIGRDDPVARLAKARAVLNSSIPNQYAKEGALGDVLKSITGDLQADLSGALQQAAEARIEGLEKIGALEKTMETNAEKRLKLHKEVNEQLQKGYITQERANKLNARIDEHYKDPKKAKGAKYQTPAGDKAEDAAQADLLALQAQLEVLRQHTGLNDKISQQRRDLQNAQAQFTVLEQSAATRQLSAQEKSLLASKDAVLASKERLAVIGDQVVQQERLNKLQDASTKYAIQMREKRDAIRESAGLSSREAQRRLEEAQLRQGWQNQGGDLNDKGYQDQLKALKDFYAEEDRLRGEWLLGAEKGWSEYLDSATNVYSSMSNIASTTLSGMSDMLTSLTTTGTASFRNFTTSILKMIVDVINKLLVAYMVQTAMGWISAGASAGASSGTANNAFSGGAYSGLKFDGGGYTGPGGKYEPAGIVHKDEFVFTKEATRQLGVGNLYALMHSAQGYANGGLVGSTITGAAPMYGLRGGGVTVDMSGMTIVTQGGGQQQPQNTGNSELVSKAIRNEVIGIVSERLEKAMGQSGSINNFIDYKIGRGK